MRVLLAQHHQLIRAGLRALLATMPGVCLDGEAGNAAELLAYLGSRAQPDLVLLDLDTPDVDGLALLEQVRARYPDLRILILSMHHSLGAVNRAFASGANGYISKDAPSRELQDALHRVMQGGPFVSDGLTKVLLLHRTPSASNELSDRQVQILCRVAQGLSSKQIASELGLSPNTVDGHRSRIMHRLGISDIAGLTRYALRNRLVQPE
ncbi:response regulator transcription factor [Ramlibacter sp. AN1133]|uniref:response regulator transcription factor n=1 Tax=Ramlibacter sp. AN1133 TaxID=3133429 RepID=UPI0030C5010E